MGGGNRGAPSLPAQVATEHGRPGRRESHEGDNGHGRRPPPDGPSASGTPYRSKIESLTTHAGALKTSAKYGSRNDARASADRATTAARGGYPTGAAPTAPKLNATGRHIAEARASGRGPGQSRRGGWRPPPRKWLAPIRTSAPRERAAARGAMTHPARGGRAEHRVQPPTLLPPAQRATSAMAKAASRAQARPPNHP